VGKEGKRDWWEKEIEIVGGERERKEERIRNGRRFTLLSLIARGW
jgi:hypothetical protein